MYAKSFRLFLKRTDEKDVVAKKLAVYCGRRRWHRVLDVGAGDGGMAVRLRPQTDEYFAVEPNPLFAAALRRQGFTVIPKAWEDADPPRQCDLVIASHVLTHLPTAALPSLLKKMYLCLRRGGYLVILTVDQHKGSWRAIHSYFNTMNRIRKRETSALLPKLLAGYEYRARKFTTRVRAESIEEMLRILTFDFYEHRRQFSKSKESLVRYLKRFIISGKVELRVVHQAIIIKRRS